MEFRPKKEDWPRGLVKMMWWDVLLVVEGAVDLKMHRWCFLQSICPSICPRNNTLEKSSKALQSEIRDRGFSGYSESIFSELL